jgi:hypothetical protein
MPPVGLFLIIDRHQRQMEAGAAVFHCPCARHLRSPALPLQPTMRFLLAPEMLFAGPHRAHGPGRQLCAAPERQRLRGGAGAVRAAGRRAAHCDQAAPGEGLCIPSAACVLFASAATSKPSTSCAVCCSILIQLPGATPAAQLVLAVAPPVALYGGRVKEGQLGLKFLRVKQNPWDTGGRQAAAACVRLLSKAVQPHCTVDAFASGLPQPPQCQSASSSA